MGRQRSRSPDHGPRVLCDLRPVVTMALDDIRVLGREDMGAFLALTTDDPVINVFAEYRARSTALEPKWLGGEVWGRFEGEVLVAACHVAANLVPVGCDEEDMRLFARHALARDRRAGTVVGPRHLVAAFLGALDGAWGKPRDERWVQPHLASHQPHRNADGETFDF